MAAGRHTTRRSRRRASTVLLALALVLAVAGAGWGALQVFGGGEVGNASEECTDDAVSLLAAIVLYIFAIGVVRGFAFALGVSTIIDVAVFFWFTKPMMTVLAKRRFFNSGHRFSGLSDETLGIDPVPNDVRMAGGRV